MIPAEDLQKLQSGTTLNNVKDFCYRYGIPFTEERISDNDIFVTLDLTVNVGAIFMENVSVTKHYYFKPTGECYQIVNFDKNKKITNNKKT